MQRYMSGFCLQELAQKPNIEDFIRSNRSDIIGFYAEIPIILGTHCPNTVQYNPNFRDITQNVEENDEILQEKLRVVSRFLCYIS